MIGNKSFHFYFLKLGRFPYWSLPLSAMGSMGYCSYVYIQFALLIPLGRLPIGHMFHLSYIYLVLCKIFSMSHWSNVPLVFRAIGPCACHIDPTPHWVYVQTGSFPLIDRTSNWSDVQFVIGLQHYLKFKTSSNLILLL